MIGRLIIPGIWDVVGIYGIFRATAALSRSFRTRTYLHARGDHTLEDITNERITLKLTILLALILNFILSIAATIVVLIDGNFLSTAISLSAGPVLTVVELCLVYLAHRLERLRVRTTPVLPEDQPASQEVKR